MPSYANPKSVLIVSIPLDKGKKPKCHVRCNSNFIHYNF